MSFQDPMEVNGAMIIDSLHSPNYVPGVSGWTINKDGTSEFQASTLRGTFQVGAGPNSTVVVGPGNQPYIEFTDNAGNKYDIITQNVGARALQIIPAVGGAARINFYNTGGVGFVTGSVNNGVLFDEHDGYLKVATAPGGTNIADGWTDAVLQNGWTNLGGNFANVGWRLMPDGLIALRGVCINGTNANGTIIFNIPASVRPAKAQEFLVRNSTNSASYFQLQTNGDLQLNNAVGANSLSLDGCQFWTVS